MNSRYRKTLTQSLDEVKIRSLYMKGKEKESVEVIAKKLGMSIKDVRKLMGEANIDVDNVKKGQVQFRSDKGGILHCIIGKLSFQSDDLLENMKELIGVVSKLRPASAKGIFLKKISLSSTMGPGLTVDVNFFK